MMELGGNIKLDGFREVDRPELVVVKKIVGSYARKFSDMLGDEFEELSLSLKLVHKKEKSEKYELHAKVMKKGKPYAAEVTDRNLFVAMDSVLKKLQVEIEK